MSDQQQPPTDVRRHRITRDDLRLFSASIGEERPMYHSVRAARAGGHPDVLAPPTYLFGLTLRTGSPFAWATELGFDMSRALHGEQEFDYRAQVYAGDSLVLRSTSTPVTKSERSQRLTRHTEVTRDGVLVASTTTTLVIVGTDS